MTSALAQSICLGVAGVFALAVAGERAVACRRRPETARAYLATSLSLLGVALLLNVVEVGRFVDAQVLNVPNAAILVSQVLSAGAAWAAVEMVAASAGRPRRNHRLARAGVTLLLAAMLVTAFAYTSQRPELPVVQLFADTSRANDWRPYWTVFGVIILVPVLIVAVLSARHARVAETWLRAGLYLVTLGAVVNATFASFVIASLWMAAAPWIAVAQMALAATGDVLIGVGCALPHVPEVRSRRAVRPMWASLTALYPEVRVGRRPDLRRIVTEVHDCVVVARTRDELASPLIRAVDRLPQRPADHFDDTVADLVGVARQRLTPVWDDEPADVPTATGSLR